MIKNGIQQIGLISQIKSSQSMKLMIDKQQFAFKWAQLIEWTTQIKTVFQLQFLLYIFSYLLSSPSRVLIIPSMLLNEKNICSQLKQLEHILIPACSHKGIQICTTQLRRQLLNCKPNFYGTVERNILLFRLKLKDTISSICEKSPQMTISSGEASIHKFLRKKLQVINSDLDHLLAEGLLTLYIEVNQLRSFFGTIKVTNITSDLLKCIIETLNNLLKLYFVFQEYQTRKRRTQKHSTNSSLYTLQTLPPIASLKHCQNQTHQIDQTLISEIVQSIKDMPLSDLFEAQMRKQKRRMRNQLEICRICFTQVKIKNLEKHVNTCAKKSHVRVELEAKNKQISEVEKQLKLRYIESCEQSLHESIDENFRKICKLILHPLRLNDRKVTKRNSLIGVKSTKNVNQRIQFYIQDYLEQYGEDILLQTLLSRYRERSLIEKKLNRLETSCLFECQNNRKSSTNEDFTMNTNLRRSNAKNNTIYVENLSIQKKSLLQKKQSFQLFRLCEERMESEDIQINETSTQSIELEKDQREFDEFKDKICKKPTKRSLSRKTGKEKQYFMEYDLNIVKHYSSLPIIRYQAKQEHENGTRVSLKDFQILQFLGQGAFGKVYMARRKQTKDIYALKIIKLSERYTQKQLQSIKNEHQIFKKIAGDHLCKTPFSFSEQSAHVFVLQFLPGGDLRGVLNEEVYLEEDQAKFYLSEIVLAIEHLHNYGIIHRDLKPQNLVVDRKGHLKLTDFGLSEFQVNKKLKKTRKASFEEKAPRDRSRRKRRTAVCGVVKEKMNLIGTPDYIAPEIINQVSLNNYSIDWWSLGVMAYELMIGTRPFCADTIDDIVDNIIQFNIEWPQVGHDEGMISSEAKDFIEKLLDKNFTTRLGANGVYQIKNHPFFKGIDWVNLKHATPAFAPRKMAKHSQLVNLQQNKNLTQEIKNFLHRGGNKKPKNLNLQTVVRFDLLKSETIQNMVNKQEMNSKKLKRLKTLKDITNALEESSEL